jgi:HlyD family secretion protein
MTANATVETARRENALRLPNAALRFKPPDGAVVAPSDRSAAADDRKTVYALDDSGGLRRQPVRLGISDGTWTEVLEPGPAEGTLIATGIQTAADKEKEAQAGGRSPFMPRRPRGGERPPPPPM